MARPLYRLVVPVVQGVAKSAMPLVLLAVASMPHSALELLLLVLLAPDGVPRDLVP